MSNEDNLHGLEDLDDTRVSADELRAMPMSVPPAKPERKKAKYNFRQLPKEAWPHVKVYDRYGIEQKDVIEFDPETFEGVRAFRDGSQQKVYLFNGYVSAAGVDHPDEEQLPEIIQDVRTEVKLKGKVTGNANIEQADRSTRTLLRVQETPAAASLKCPKCQSTLRLDEIIENDGEVKHGIVCSNGNCGMSWHTNGGVGKG
jgi:hypothetical protein